MQKNKSVLFFSLVYLLVFISVANTVEAEEIIIDPQKDLATIREFFILPHEKSREEKIIHEAQEYIKGAKQIEAREISRNYFKNKIFRRTFEEGKIDLKKEAYSTKEIGREGRGISSSTSTILSVETPTEEEPRGFLKRARDFLKNIGKNTLSIFSGWQVWAQGGDSQERALAYLLSVQKEDFSWGEKNDKIITTARVLRTLYGLGLATTTEAQNGKGWLENVLTDNTSYQALQIETLSLLGASEINEAQQLSGKQKQNSGGFSFAREFEEDALTTARALLALTQAGFEDTGSNPHFTTSLALYYLIQSQNQDGGFSMQKNKASSLWVTASVLRALLSYKDTSLVGFEAEDVHLAPVIHKGITYLRSLQKENGSWNDTILDTAEVFSLLHMGEVVPQYDSAATSYLEANQKSDGSFENNSYATAVVLEALHYGKSKLGAIKGNDIVPMSSLQTGVPLLFNISLTNTGDQPVSTGVLRLFADNVFLYSYDFAQAHITIPPHETRLLLVSIPQTWNFVGNVSFSYFFEGTNELTHPESWYSESLSFGESANGYPGLPMYFVAHQSEQDGAPALNVRWQPKEDRLLLRYEIMWRRVGDSAWNFIPIPNSTWNGVFLWGGFIEGGTYQVTVASRSLNGNDYIFFDQPVLVRVSNNPTRYRGGVSGSLLDIGSPLPQKDVFGFSISATTREDGSFEIINTPNGRSAAWINEPAYESLITVFATPETGTTSAVSLYTHPKNDTQDPAVDTLLLMSPPNPLVNKRNYTLYAHGSDDTGVISGSFSYYDPHDLSWHLIAPAESYDTQSIQASWYIPGSFIGSGYQLKASLLDFNGNAGERIITLPTISMGNSIPDINLIEPNGIGDTGDQSFIISWEDMDEDDNAQISLYYNAASSTVGVIPIIENIFEDDFLNQYTWDTKTIPSGSYYLVARIFDGHNPAVWNVNPHPLFISHSGTTTSSPPPPPTPSVNIPPTARIVEPNGINDKATGQFSIQFDADDPDNNATVSVYYDTNNFGADGTLIKSNLKEDTATSTVWNTSQIPAKNYFIYLVLNDGVNPQQVVYSTYPVQVRHGGK